MANTIVKIPYTYGLHCAKNETSLLQWNLDSDILMTLSIKWVHNLPPHLSYVSTLPNSVSGSEKNRFGM